MVVQIGRIFKDTLLISPAGISWKNQSYPVHAVSTCALGCTSAIG